MGGGRGVHPQAAQVGALTAPVAPMALVAKAAQVARVVEPPGPGVEVEAPEAAVAA